MKSGFLIASRLVLCIISILGEWLRGAIFPIIWMEVLYWIIMRGNKNGRTEAGLL